jgi:hypothetical protein
MATCSERDEERGLTPIIPGSDSYFDGSFATHSQLHRHRAVLADPPTVEYIREANPEALSAEVDALFERALHEYGDSDRQKAAKVMVKKGMNWPSWWDQRDGDGPIATEWNVHGSPMICVLDQKGVIRYKNVLREELVKAVDALLKEMEPKNVAGQ